MPNRCAANILSSAADGWPALARSLFTSLSRLSSISSSSKIDSNDAMAGWADLGCCGDWGGVPLALALTLTELTVGGAVGGDAAGMLAGAAGDEACRLPTLGEEPTVVGGADGA